MNPAEFANIAESEKHFWWYRGMREILHGMLDPLLGGRQISRGLDAGCGTGYFAKLVQQRYEFPVVAIDYGWPGLQHARGMGLQRIAQADVQALPFSEGAFGLVLSMDVLVHFESGKEGPALQQMARVLAPSGLLAIRVAAFDALRSRHSMFAHERQRFTQTALVRGVEAQGLRVLRSTYVNCFLSPIAFAKFRLWEPLTRQPPASGVKPVSAWLDSALYAPLALEAKLTHAGLNLPFGQSLIVIAEKQC